MVSQIYPSELQFNKANTSDTKAAFLDLHLVISNDIVSTKIYDKRDGFDFEIVNFSFLDGDVPRSTSYGVYISQLIRFARASSYVADFNTRNKLLTQKLLKQGYGYHKIRKYFLNFIDDTMIWYLNSKLDLNLSCAKHFWNLNSMVTWWIKWWRLFALIIFQRSSLTLFPIIKSLAITLMYCNRLHAWWSTQSWLATLLSSLIAHRWVGLQTLWWVWLKDLSIDEMVGARYFGCLSGPPGFTCWISFAPVFSFIYCWVLIFASYPCYILICVFWEMMHW